MATKRQPVHGDSSASCELIGAHAGVKDALAIAAGTAQCNIGNTIDLMIDNRAVLHAIERGSSHKMAAYTRATRVSAGFIKDTVDLGYLRASHVAGPNNRANLLTKILPAAQLAIERELGGIWKDGTLPKWFNHPDTDKPEYDDYLNVLRQEFTRVLKGDNKDNIQQAISKAVAHHVVGDTWSLAIRQIGTAHSPPPYPKRYTGAKVNVNNRALTLRLAPAGDMIDVSCNNNHEEEQRVLHLSRTSVTIFFTEDAEFRTTGVATTDKVSKLDRPRAPLSPSV